MGKHLEKKILEELRKRVLEKDRELQEKANTKDVLSANIEVLSEMTNLNQNEVSKIAQQVRAEMEAEERVKRKRLTTILVISGVVLFIAAIVVFNKMNVTPPLVFEENFDNNNNGWAVFDEYEYNRYLENGSYVHQINQADWCYWDYIEVAFPQKYSVEVKSEWLKGKFDEYGFQLVETNSDYIAFQIKPDGAASYAIREGEDWAINESWADNICNKGENVQKVVVNGSNFEYYVNDKLFKKGTLLNTNPIKIGLRVCDKQTVAFQHVTIKNEQTGAVILEETFDNNNNKWEPKMEFEKFSEIKDGMYMITTTVEDFCNWKDIAIPFTSEQDYDLNITSIWKEGEEANYGVMLLVDDDNYISFELQSAGNARAVKSYYGEYNYIGDYVKTGISYNGNNSVTQTIKKRGDSYEYYVNNQLIDAGYLDYMYISRVGVRCCGQQTVYFDKIRIEEVK